MPVIMICILEISLRIFNYGHNLSLFIEYPHDKTFLVMNPDASKRYFPDQKVATTGNVELFKKIKDKGTLRIFVLGESTTIGYPYFHNGSFHRWLQYRLMHLFPDKNFEIINLSLTAVNSYTVLGFAKEVVNYQPDAVLIYTGHNEYYGALGVGSTQKIGGNPQLVNFILTLRGLRMVQLMTNAYEGVIRLFGNHRPSEGEARMELMVANQQIPYQSKLFNKGVEQFRSNMDETLHLFDKYHVPVFVSNLVSNEKDLPPFISASVDSVRFPGFKKKYDEGVMAYKKNDLQAANTFFMEANQEYSQFAMCNFYIGSLAYCMGDSIRAKKYFSNAKALDMLRFRAPDTLNTIISQLCGKYKEAHLADTKSLFQLHSKYGIMGDELILDHVHPNLTGYALMSDVFYRALKKQGIFPAGKEKEISFRQLLQEMPITKVDSLTGIYRIQNLKSHWPFSETPVRESTKTGSEEESLAYAIIYNHMPWEDAMNQLYSYSIEQKDYRKAGVVLEALVLEHPKEESFYERSANLFGEAGDYENSAFYFKKAFALSPSFDKARYLFVIYLKLDQPEKALPYLDYAIQNNTSGINLIPVKEGVAEIIQLQKTASENLGDISVLNHVASKYFQMGNKEVANKYIEKVLKVDPENKEAHALLSMLKKGK